MFENARAPESVASRLLSEHKIERGIHDYRSCQELVIAYALRGRIPLEQLPEEPLREVGLIVLAAVSALPSVPPSLSEALPTPHQTQARNMTANVEPEKSRYFASV